MLWFLGASSENKLLIELFWQPWSLLWLSLRTSGCLKQVGMVVKRSSFTKFSGELSKANIVWFALIFSFKIVFLITHVFWHDILGSIQVTNLLCANYFLATLSTLAWCWCASVQCGHCAARRDMVTKTRTWNWKSWNLFQQQQSQQLGYNLQRNMGEIFQDNMHHWKCIMLRKCHLQEVFIMQKRVISWSLVSSSWSNGWKQRPMQCVWRIIACWLWYRHLYGSNFMTIFCQIKFSPKIFLVIKCEGSEISFAAVQGSLELAISSDL